LISSVIACTSIGTAAFGGLGNSQVVPVGST
jgi:hypothetical protein